MLTGLFRFGSGLYSRIVKAIPLQSAQPHHDHCIDRRIGRHDGGVWFPRNLGIRGSWQRPGDRGRASYCVAIWSLSSLEPPFSRLSSLCRRLSDQADFLNNPRAPTDDTARASGQHTDFAPRYKLKLNGNPQAPDFSLFSFASLRFFKAAKGLTRLSSSPSVGNSTAASDFLG